MKKYPDHNLIEYLSNKYLTHGLKSLTKNEQVDLINHLRECYNQQKQTVKSIDKYTMFKQFIHNELDISKADIKQWTQSTVKQVVENYIKHQLNIENIINKVITKVIFDSSSSFGLRTIIEDVVTDELQKKLEIKIN